MEIIVRKAIKYKELKIKEGLAQIETGLLNDEECVALARALIDAAYDLIYDFEEDAAQKLVNILNEEF